MFGNVSLFILAVFLIVGGAMFLIWIFSYSSGEAERKWQKDIQDNEFNKGE